MEYINIYKQTSNSCNTILLVSDFFQNKKEYVLKVDEYSIIFRIAMIDDKNTLVCIKSNAMYGLRFNTTRTLPLGKFYMVERTEDEIVFEITTNLN